MYNRNMKKRQHTKTPETTPSRGTAEIPKRSALIELHQDALESGKLFGTTVRDAIQEVRSKVADEIVTKDGPVLETRMTRESAEVSVGDVDIAYNAIPSSSLNDPSARVRIVSGNDILLFGQADDYNYDYKGNWAQLSQRVSDEGEEVLVWKVDLQGPYPDRAFLRVTGADKSAEVDNEEASAIKQMEEATLAIDDMLQKLR